MVKQLSALVAVCTFMVASVGPQSQKLMSKMLYHDGPSYARGVELTPFDPPKLLPATFFDFVPRGVVLIYELRLRRL